MEKVLEIFRLKKNKDITSKSITHKNDIQKNITEIDRKMKTYISEQERIFLF